MFSVKSFLCVAGACGVLWAAAGAHARTLHYGDSAVELTSEKVTSPALHVQFDTGEMAYGALYDVAEREAPANTLHVAYDGNEYWLGPRCIPWLPHLGMQCVNYVNRILSLDEVNEILPVTDLGEYEELPELYNWQGCSNTDNVRTGTLYPGTYLFILVIDNNGCPGKTNPTNGKGGIINAYTVIFDHAVSVESLAKCGAFSFSIDTSGPEYKTETFRIPYVCDNQQWTNVTGLGSVSAGIHIYMLK